MKNTTYHKDTPERVQDILESARINHTRLRLHLGDTKTGELWLEEFDVAGYIGRSTGERKIPLLLNKSHSTGGPAILDKCILGIQDMVTKAWLYKNPIMKMPKLVIVNTTDEIVPYEVHKKTEVIARFPEKKEAENYVNFMLGNRMRVN